MTAPSTTLPAIRAFNPCPHNFMRAEDTLPPRRRITVRMAVKAGTSLSDICWTLSRLAPDDEDIARRLQLWSADCAAHVLHFFEDAQNNTAPRLAIIAARQHARSQTKTAARSAARAAAGEARAAARAAGEATGAAAWAAARAAAWAARAAAWAAARAAREAAWAAARAAARVAAREAAWEAAWEAEGKWQTDRLVLWFSSREPTDWPLTETGGTEP